jgi:hypothetical protein
MWRQRSWLVVSAFRREIWLGFPLLGRVRLDAGMATRKFGSEGPVALTTIPTRNPQSRREYSLVTAMADKAGAAGCQEAAL